MILTQKLRQMMALTLVPGMGPVAFRNGLLTFGSLEGIFGATASEWRGVQYLSRLNKRLLDDPAIFRKADEEIEKALKADTAILTFFDGAYPSELKEIHDPPIVLYVKGRLPEKKHPRIAVVGSRAASLYGLKMAERVSRELAAAGMVVVSGLAIGIDTAAHKGALSAKGWTLAVLGGGISKIYPAENKKIAAEIVKTGALISEYPMDFYPKPGNFPVRNRIISGLSRAVLVAEARVKSGALITADLALEQGRDVYALPGPADSTKSEGSNALLKQGAHFITGAEDILREYSTDLRKTQTKKISVTEEEKKLLSLLGGPEALHLDEIITRSEFPTQKAMGLLSVLAIKGAVQELPGKYFMEKA